MSVIIHHYKCTLLDPNGERSFKYPKLITNDWWFRDTYKSGVAARFVVESISFKINALFNTVTVEFEYGKYAISTKTVNDEIYLCHLLLYEFKENNSFKRIINLIDINQKIFEYVREINDLTCKNRLQKYVSPNRPDSLDSAKATLRCNWQQLACFPSELVRFRLNQRFKEVLESLLIAMTTATAPDSSQAFPTNFLSSFLKSLTKAASRGNLELIQYTFERCLEYKIDLNSGAYQIDFTKIFNKAVAKGHLPIVEYIFRVSKIADSSDGMQIACCNANLEIATFILANGWFGENGTGKMWMYHAALSGHIHILELLHQSNIPQNLKGAMDGVASKGLLSVMTWLHKNRNEQYTQSTLKSAVKNNHFDIVKFLHLNGEFVSTENLVDLAAGTGNLEMVKYLCEVMGHSGSPKAVDAASSLGFLPVVEYLLPQSGCTANAFDKAANQGHLEIVQYLHSNSTAGCTRAAMTFTVSNPQYLPVLEFLVANRTEGAAPPMAMNFAASKGNLEAVKILHEKLDHSFEFELLDMVASGGHFEVFKYIHSKGANCTESSMDYFCKFGNIEPLEWLAKNRTEGCSDFGYYMAAMYGHLAPIIWIHKNYNLPCHPDAVAAAAKTGNLELVRYLVEELKAPVDLMAIINAGTRGHLPIVQFLIPHSTQESMERALESATINRHLPVIEFLSSTVSIPSTTKQTKIINSVCYDYRNRLNFIQSNKL
ncbi:hypothetical protein PPL_08430 [Heterostelium album PN500]|uniref:Ankyrin repeat protein n=1 Tax=Heterostelium pallidum (strain ATCC 26659 / Pp 5 / PN500) TaxID=670386 RepID=D3BI62_HETP5|nr:hypothetical protein PPL_08430 [Heterostelium album PN500]EFA78962.1 hypothetical protein PPL_08430 [Heterostelium album PN500]|eukprot:XP_020431086.1 hypothetical protein PPL_08430 [Heterostelium album PN500]